MEEKVNLELVYSTTQIIGCFNKDRLLNFYDSLKNHLIRHNRNKRPYQKVEISTLSTIEKKVLCKYKEHFDKETWEEMYQKVKLNNLDGESLFEYQANYEISIFKDSESLSVYKDGHEVEHFFELQNDLRQEQELVNERFGFDGDIYDEVFERNWPDLPKDFTENENKKLTEYSIKLAKWAEKNAPSQVENAMIWGRLINRQDPDYKDIEHIPITEKDHKNRINIQKRYWDEKEEEKKEKIKKSWE